MWNGASFALLYVCMKLFGKFVPIFVQALVFEYAETNRSSGMVYEDIFFLENVSVCKINFVESRYSFK